MRPEVPTKIELRQALKALCEAIGELPVIATDQATYKAYTAATELLEPDEFNKRFMVARELSK